MQKLSLNGAWQMRQVGEDAFLPASVPGTVSQALLAAGRIPDPYVRDNELKIAPVFERDYEFRRTFFADAALLSRRRARLRCEGLDTLCELFLNGQSVGTADNMHRTWEFDVKALLVPGENELRAVFRSPVKYLSEHPPRASRPFVAIRKAACMFGWDWGLTLPDMGIWRDIAVIAFDARIRGATIRQSHGADGVRLRVEPALEAAEGDALAVTLTSPAGDVLYCETRAPGPVEIDVRQPELWWPAGQGAQPLYALALSLRRDGIEIDRWERRVGLRTIRLNRDADALGHAYEFIVNGRRVFFMGENLIIDDAMLRTDDARMRALADSCVRSGLNGVRVWGGAYYPPDLFYDLCDERGLMVYQDHMFACAFYELSDAFVENVRREAEDNLSRIAHHACIALLCGNNEIDSILTVAGSTEPETMKLRELFGGIAMDARTLSYLRGEYDALFKDVLREASARFAPDTSYVHSSPSSASDAPPDSFFDYLRDGDMHYYLQYDGNAPYQKMRQLHCRFVSEIGFQSYPSMKTIRAFADEADLGPATDVMYAHQKCANGNEAIEIYMARDYVVPTDFDDYVYLSQLQAGEIMRYSVEHFRREGDTCGGVILWQLNDCWPVVSWSGIDAFGRWKALQYYIKRFFAPVHLSARDDAGRAELWIVNDSPEAFDGTIRWALMRDGDGALRHGEQPARVAPGARAMCLALDCETDPGAYLTYALEAGGQTLSRGVSLFARAKDFPLRAPNLSIECAERADRYIVRLASDCLAKGVALDIAAGDARFSDNFFDIAGGETREIAIEKADAPGIRSIDDLRDRLTVKTLNQVMRAGQNL